MRYDKYLKKILAFARILKTIRRYRVLISIVASIAIVSTATFMGVQGMVYDSVACPTEIEYGDTLPFEANAVFRSVRYEYASQSSPDNWSDIAPTLPGTYHVRAASTSTFGTPRYGDVYTYTIIPRKINVGVEQSQIIYGDEPSVIAPLVYGDTISCSNYIYEDVSLKQTKVIARKDAIVIKDKSGNDVTSYYNISTVQSELEFIPRKITVTVSSASSVYNGIPLSFDGFELTGGAMAYTDTLYPVINTSITDVGQIENIAESWLVINSENVNVTLHYDITQIAGTLSVDKRPLVIETGGSSSVYDGTSKEYTQFTVLEGGDNQGLLPADGHKVTVTSATSIINVGSVQNLLTFGVFDADGKDVSSNYAIFVSNPKTLEVTKRPVTLTTGNYTGIYDDQYHTNDQYVLSDMGLAGGQTPVYSNSSKIIDVGEVSNAVTLNVVDASGNNVTSNYEISYSYGTLKVNPLEVNILTSSAEKTYDGSPLTSQGYSISGNLVSGHSHSYLSSTAITDVSVDADGNITDVLNLVNISIVNAAGNDVTHNYAFNYGENNANLGKLKILPREITISTHSKTFVYDGLAHNFLDFTAEDEEEKGFNIENGELVEGHILCAIAEASASVQYVSQGTVQNTIEFEFADSEGNPVSRDNYVIICPEENIGTINVVPLEITVTTNSDEFTYDGTVHTGTYSADTLPDGHEFSIISATELTDVISDQRNEIVLAITFEGNPVAEDNYHVTYHYGNISILKREISIITNTNYWTYDGYYHYDEGYSYAQDSLELVEGHSIIFDSSATPQVKDVSNTHTTNNLTVISIVDNNNVDVSANYVIPTEENGGIAFGEIYIVPRNITINTNSHTWVYDDLPHSDAGWEIESGDLAYCDEIVVADIVPTITNVTDGDNGVIFNDCIEGIFSIESDDDVSDNYNITMNFGQLKIRPRTIHVNTRDGSWTYDGYEHYTKLYDIVPGDGTNNFDVVEGHDLVCTRYTTVIEVPDPKDEFVKNDLRFQVVNALGKDKTDNYQIIIKTFGQLVIMPREITVTTCDNKWTYDGNQYSDTRYNLDKSTLAPNQNDELDTSKEIASVTNTWDTKDKNNIFAIKITDENGKNTTRNYAITYVYGKLTINSKELIVKTDSESWIYDGIAHSNENFEVFDDQGVLFDYTSLGQSAIVNKTDPTTSVINTWDTGENIFSIAITHPNDDPNGHSVMENYTLTYEYGTLEILQRKIEVETYNGEWIYDGQSHSNTELNDTNGGFSIGGDGLCNSLYYKRIPTSSVTNVFDGDVDNTIEFNVYLDENCTQPVDPNNCEITINPIGKLRIIKRNLVLNTFDGEWVYDGLWHGNSGLKVENGGYELVDHGLGDYLYSKIITEKEIKNVRTTPNEITVKLYLDKDCTDTKKVDERNYEISIGTIGTLKITPRPITITAASDTKVYDDQYFDNYEFTVDNLVDFHKLQCDVIHTNSPYDYIDVGEYSNIPTNAIIHDENGNDVTNNYDITYVDGILTITPRPFHIQTKSGSWVYDAQPHSLPEFEYLDTTPYYLVEGHSINFTEPYPSITDYVDGGTPNSLEIESILSSEGRNVTDNYLLPTVEEGTLVYGTLEIIKRPITIQTGSGIWMYDGKPHTIDTFEILTPSNAENEGLVSGQTIRVKETTLTYKKDYGIYENIFGILIFSSEEKDVTNNYNITYNYGTLEITQRPIKIETATHLWEYDGQEHYDNDFEIKANVPEDYDENSDIIIDGEAFYPLANGDSASVTSYTTIVNVGTKENVLVIMISNGIEDVTNNYYIDFDNGILEITPKSLTIKSETKQKFYDGTPLTGKEPIIEGLVNGQTVNVDIIGSQTEPGSSPNTIIQNAKIIDENSVDVTDNYIINYEEGTLTVLKRQVVVKFDSKEFIYNGTDQMHPFGSVFDGEIKVDSFTIVPQNSQTEIPTVREVGDEKDNYFAYKIVSIEDSETNLTDFFEITEEIPGKLTVVIGDDDDDDGDGGSGGGGSGEGGSGEGGSGGGGTGEGGSGGGTGGNLDTSGNLGGSQSGSGSGSGSGKVIVMKIKSTVTGSIYMRLMSYGAYTGQGWGEAPINSTLIDGKYSNNFLTGSTLGMNNYTEATLEVESFTSQYFLPYYISMYDGSLAPLPNNDVIFDNAHSGKYTVPYYLYTGYGSELNKQDSVDEKTYAAFVYENYLSIDNNGTKAYIEQLIAEQGWDRNDPNIISIVAQYVQNVAVYNLEYDPRLDEAEDAVVAFLKQEYNEGGVCRHYASAATLIYRALGIPARYTIGYVGKTQADEWTEITNKQGHAWTEVYINGVGWIMVEVTGSGFNDGTGESGGSGGSGGSGDVGGGENFKPELIIRPKYHSKLWDGTTLYATNELDEMQIELRELLALGYNYVATVEGELSVVGQGKSKVLSFTLYDPNGQDVTDEYDIKYEEGLLEIFDAEYKLIATVYEINKTYDGKPIAYSPDDYYSLSLESIHSNALLDNFTISLLIYGELTNVGILPLEEITYDLTVIDKDGNDVTDKFCVEFIGIPLTVNKRKITVTSSTSEKPYDSEKPLINQYAYISFGSLAEGHWLDAKASGYLEYEGSIYNEIFDSNIKIFDSNGNDVTDNYEIDKVLGTLTYY